MPVGEKFNTMKHILKILLVAVLSMATSEVSSHDFEVDGIYYIITSSATPYTVAVTYQGSSYSQYNEYTGSVTIPETVTYNGKTYSVTSIGYQAFSGCSGLTSITIGNSVTSIDDYTFSGCKGLTSVTIPNSVKYLGPGAFYDCRGLTSIEIGNSVTGIGERTFQWCEGLTSIEIPNSVTYIGDWAFCNCTGLTSITIPESVTSIGNYAFNRCTGLTSIEIGNGVTEIGEYAFHSCRGLTAVTIPNSVISIGDFAFVDSGVRCFVIADGDSYIRIGRKFLSSSPTETLYMGRDFSFSEDFFIDKMGISKTLYGVTAVGQRAFYGCEKLKSFNIPEGVKKIENCTFKDCKRLSDLRIGSGVEEIGDSVFYNCPLTRIYNYAEYPQACGKGVFSIVKYYCKLFVKEDSQDFYRVSPDWSGFNIQAMDAEALAISPILESQGDEEPYYDLNGRKVGKAKNGIYIHNGRKTVVK